MSTICGIYGLVNRRNGKVYVGSSVDLTTRTRKHLRWLRLGTHYNPHLQAAYTLGDRFTVRILEQCAADVLLVREDHWMIVLGTLDRANGYNMAEAVRKAPSEDGRRRISESRKGKTWEEIYGTEQAANLRDEYRNRFGGENNPMYGRCGEAHPFFGKTTTELFGEDVAEKMAEATSVSHKGKHLSKETRERISKAHSGKVLSEDHKEAIGAGIRQYHESVGPRTFEEIHGEQADDIRRRIAAGVKGKFKGVSWEEMMGAERAAERKRKMSERKQTHPCNGCKCQIPKRKKWCRPCWLEYNRRPRGITPTGKST